MGYQNGVPVRNPNGKKWIPMMFPRKIDNFGAMVLFSFRAMKSYEYLQLLLRSTKYLHADMVSLVQNCIMDTDTSTWYGQFQKMFCSK